MSTDGNIGERKYATVCDQKRNMIGREKRWRTTVKERKEGRSKMEIRDVACNFSSLLQKQQQTNHLDI